MLALVCRAANFADFQGKTGFDRVEQGALADARRSGERSRPPCNGVAKFVDAFHGGRTGEVDTVPSPCVPPEFSDHVGIDPEVDLVQADPSLEPGSRARGKQPVDKSPSWKRMRCGRHDDDLVEVCDEGLPHWDFAVGHSLPGQGTCPGQHFVYHSRRDLHS